MFLQVSAFSDVFRAQRQRCWGHTDPSVGPACATGERLDLRPVSSPARPWLYAVKIMGVLVITSSGDPPHNAFPGVPDSASVGVVNKVLRAVVRSRRRPDAEVRMRAGDRAATPTPRGCEWDQGKPGCWAWAQRKAKGVCSIGSQEGRGPGAGCSPGLQGCVCLAVALGCAVH